MSHAAPQTGSAGETYAARSRRKRPGCHYHPRPRPVTIMSASESTSAKGESDSGRIESDEPPYNRETAMSMASGNLDAVEELLWVEKTDDPAEAAADLRHAASELQYLADVFELIAERTDGGGSSE